MFTQLVEAVTYSADVDEVTGREVYPLWVVYVLAAVVFSSVFLALATVG